MANLALYGAETWALNIVNIRRHLKYGEASCIYKWTYKIILAKEIYNKRKKREATIKERQFDVN